MKTFVAVLALAAVAVADQRAHQSISLGGAPAVAHAVSQPHGQAATVHQSAPAPAPHAAPAPAPHAAPAPAPYRPAPTYAPAPAPYRPAPTYAPARPSYNAPTYADVPPQYNYQYAVQDDYANVDFSANENRDGYATAGSYTVALPDGRTQTVTYTVSDAQSGYVADVTYQGEAQYPVYEPKHAAPAYKPAPAPYRPAPAYPSL